MLLRAGFGLLAFRGFHRAAGLAELGISNHFFEVLLIEAARSGRKRRNPGVLRLQAGKENGDRDRKVARELVEILWRRLVRPGLPPGNSVGRNAKLLRKRFLAQLPSKLAN